MNTKFWSPLGRLRHKGEVNIRMNLQEIGWEGVGWMHPS
jgi:hypothetical protein